MSIVERPFASLYVELEHSFRQPDLLEEALTHPSATDGEGLGKRNLERLEFLGDRVLGLVISSLLVERFSDEKVGQLARRHTALVRTEALTRVAQDLGLGGYMKMSRSEEETGGRENPQILADCCEAVIAALYLDGGIDAASQMICQHWIPLMQETVQPPKDPKTALQEWAQGRGLPLPTYAVLAREGAAHAPVFKIQCAVCGLPRSSARGTSKRSAEQAAAQQLLRVIHSRQDNDDA
ncbi:MAG: ribonuclease III [Rhodospirillaceae bacterium]|nr:ribonuclease III [Rhodospirillaceae bacterium]